MLQSATVLQEIWESHFFFYWCVCGCFPCNAHWGQNLYELAFEILIVIEFHVIAVDTLWSLNDESAGNLPGTHHSEFLAKLGLFSGKIGPNIFKARGYFWLKYSTLCGTMSPLSMALSISLVFFSTEKLLFLGLKQATPKYLTNIIMAVKNLRNSHHTSSVGAIFDTSISKLFISTNSTWCRR